MNPDSKSVKDVSKDVSIEDYDELIHNLCDEFDSDRAKMLAAKKYGSKQNKAISFNYSRQRITFSFIYFHLYILKLSVLVRTHFMLLILHTGNAATVKILQEPLK